MGQSIIPREKRVRLSAPLSEDTRPLNEPHGQVASWSEGKLRREPPLPGHEELPLQYHTPLLEELRDKAFAHERGDLSLSTVMEAVDHPDVPRPRHIYPSISIRPKLPPWIPLSADWATLFRRECEKRVVYPQSLEQRFCPC